MPAMSCGKIAGMFAKIAHVLQKDTDSCLIERGLPLRKGWQNRHMNAVASGYDILDMCGFARRGGKAATT